MRKVTVISEINDRGFIGWEFEDSKRWASGPVKEDEAGQYFVSKKVKYYLHEIEAYLSNKKELEEMTHSLTEMERTLLNEIPLDNFYEDGFNSCLWTRIFTEDTCSIDNRKSKGVLSSLVQKGYIRIDQDPTEENEYSRSSLTLEPKAVNYYETESGLRFDEYGSLIR